MNTSKAIESAITSAINDVKSAFSANNIPEFTITIRATGRTDTGDAKLVITVAENGYSDKSVSGNTFANVLSELLRRNGWTARHAPVMIGFDGSTRQADYNE